MKMLNMNQYRPIKVLCIICLVITGLSACKKENKISFQEPVKDISGSWQIVKLTRNGEDLTSRVDLSNFRIIFNEDSTYTLEGKMAFIVNQPGTYSLNDPQYPFYISFLSSKDPGNGHKVEFSFPVVNGQRQIDLHFSPGCGSNTYNYILKRD